MTFPDSFPEHGYSSETYARTPFEGAYAEACIKFFGAIQAHQEDNRWDHFTIDVLPQRQEWFAVIKLANDYERAVEGRGESFEIGLPIASDGSIASALAAPRLLELGPPCVMVRRTRNDVPSFVTEANFDDIFGMPNPVIQDFPRKIRDFERIPARPRMTR